MNIKKHFFYRLVHFFLTISFFLSSVPAGTAQVRPNQIVSLTDSDREIDASMLEQFYFPSSVAKIREIFIPESKYPQKLVYLIQDAHCNPRAQKNIKELVKQIVDSTEVSFIGLEGAALGYLDPSILEQGPPEKRKDVCEEYIEKGILTGTEALMMCEGDQYRDLDLFGLEEPAIYLENFLALQNTFSEKKEVDRFIREWQQVIRTLKEKIYTREDLVDLDGKYEDFCQGNLKRSEYLLYLHQLWEKNQEKPAVSVLLSKEAFPNFQQTIKTAKLEKSIDFQKIQKEQEEIINALKDMPDKTEQTSLDVEEKAFKSGMLSPLRFYEKILSRIPTGFALTSENLLKYVQVLKEFKKVRTEKLLGEIREITFRLKLALCENEEERNAVLLDYAGVIMERMTDLGLTREQLKYYKEHQETFEMERLIHWPREKFEEWGLRWPGVLTSDHFAIPFALNASQDYYHGLIRRDTILTESLLHEMENRNLDQAVMITGGFHTEGITDFLRDQNIAYMVVSPVVGKATDLYYQVMMDKKTDFGILSDGLAPALILDTGLGFASIKSLKEIWIKLTGKQTIDGSLIKSAREFRYESLDTKAQASLLKSMETLEKSEVPENVKLLLTEIKTRLKEKDKETEQSEKKQKTKEVFSQKKGSNSGTLRETGQPDSMSYLTQIEKLKEKENGFLKKGFKEGEDYIEADFGDDITVIAYHFKKDDQDIIVLNNNKKIIQSIGQPRYEELKKEALFHEKKEIEWVEKIRKAFPDEEYADLELKAARWSHIIASALQVLEYGKNGLSPFHQMDIHQKNVDDLEALIEEFDKGRLEQKRVLEWATLNGLKLDFDVIKTYEEKFIKEVKTRLAEKSDRDKLRKAYEEALHRNRTTKLYDARAGSVKNLSSKNAYYVQRLNEYERAAQLFHLFQKHHDVITRANEYIVWEEEILRDESSVFMAAASLLRGPNVKKVEKLFNNLAAQHSFRSLNGEEMRYTLDGFIQRFFPSTDSFGGGRAGYLLSVLKNGEPSPEHRLALRLGFYHWASGDMNDVFAYAKTLSPADLMEYLADPLVHKKMDKYLYRRLVALMEHKAGILIRKDQVSSETELRRYFEIMKMDNLMMIFQSKETLSSQINTLLKEIKQIKINCKDLKKINHLNSAEIDSLLEEITKVKNYLLKKESVVSKSQKEEDLNKRDELIEAHRKNIQDRILKLNQQVFRARIPDFLWREMGKEYKTIKGLFLSSADKECFQIFKQHLHHYMFSQKLNTHFFGRSKKLNWGAFKKEIMEWASHAKKEEITMILQKDSMFQQVLQRQYLNLFKLGSLTSTRKKNWETLNKELEALKNDRQTDRTIQQISIYLDRQAKRYWVTRKSSDKKTTSHISEMLRLDQKVEPAEALLEWALKNGMKVSLCQKYEDTARDAYKNFLVHVQKCELKKAEVQAETAEMEDLIPFFAKIAAKEKTLFDAAFQILERKMKKATLNSSQIQSLKLQMQYGNAAGENYIKLYRLTHPVAKIKKLGIKKVFRFQKKVLDIVKEISPQDPEFELLRNDHALLRLIKAKVSKKAWHLIENILQPKAKDLNGEEPYSDKILFSEDISRLTGKNDQIRFSAEYWAALLNANLSRRRAMYYTVYLAQLAIEEKFSAVQDKKERRNKINTFLNHILQSSKILNSDSLWRFIRGNRYCIKDEYKDLIAALKKGKRINAQKLVREMGGFFSLPNMRGISPRFHLKRKTDQTEFKAIIQTLPAKDLLQNWSNFEELKKHYFQRKILEEQFKKYEIDFKEKQKEFLEWQRQTSLETGELEKTITKLEEEKKAAEEDLQKNVSLKESEQRELTEAKKSFDRREQRKEKLKRAISKKKTKLSLSRKEEERGRLREEIENDQLKLKKIRVRIKERKKDIAKFKKGIGEAKAAIREKKTEISEKETKIQKNRQAIEDAKKKWKEKGKNLAEAKEEVEEAQKALKTREKKIFDFKLDLHPDILSSMEKELKRADRIEMLILLRNRLADELETSEDLQKYILEETDHQLSPSFFLYSGESVRATGMIERERLLQSGVQWRAFSNKSFIRSECCHDILGKVREIESKLGELRFASKEEREKQVKELLSSLPELIENLEKEQEAFKSVRAKYNARVKLIISTIIAIAGTALCIGLGIPAVPAWIQFAFAIAQAFVAKGVDFMVDWALNGDSTNKMNLPFEMLTDLVVASVSTLIAGGVNWWLDFQAIKLWSLSGENAGEIAMRVFGIAALGVAKGQINSAISDPIAYLMEQYFGTSNSIDNFFSDTAKALQKRLMAMPKQIIFAYLRAVAFHAVKQQNFLKGIRYRTIAPTYTDRNREENFSKTDWELSNPFGLFGEGQYNWTPDSDQIGWKASLQGTVEEFAKTGILQMQNALLGLSGSSESNTTVSKRSKDKGYDALMKSFQENEESLSKKTNELEEKKNETLKQMLLDKLKHYKIKDRSKKEIIKEFRQKLEQKDVSFENVYKEYIQNSAIKSTMKRILKKIEKNEDFKKILNSWHNSLSDLKELNLNSLLLKDTYENSPESLPALIQSFLLVERNDSELKDALEKACNLYLKGNPFDIASLKKKEWTLKKAKTSYVQNKNPLPLELLSAHGSKHLRIPGDGDCLFASVIVSALRDYLEEGKAKQFSDNYEKLVGSTEGLEEIKDIIRRYIQAPSTAKDSPLRSEKFKDLIRKVRTRTVDHYETSLPGVTESEAVDRGYEDKVDEFKSLMKKPFNAKAAEERDEIETRLTKAKFIEKVKGEKLKTLESEFTQKKEEAIVLWGGDIDVRVMSDLLQRPVFVFKRTPEGARYQLSKQYGETFKDAEPLHLLYSSGNHYEVLNLNQISGNIVEIKNRKQIEDRKETFIQEILKLHDAIRTNKKASNEDRILATLLSLFLQYYLENKNKQTAEKQTLDVSSALSPLDLKRFQETLKRLDSTDKKEKIEESALKTEKLKKKALRQTVEPKKIEAESEKKDGKGFIGAGNKGEGRLIQKEEGIYLEVTEEDHAPKLTRVMESFNKIGEPQGLTETEQQGFEKSKKNVLSFLDKEEVKEFLKKNGVKEEKLNGVILGAKANLSRLFSFDALKNSEGKYVLSCGVDGQIGFDSEFFNALLQKPGLLEIVLFHEALESVTPPGMHDQIRELQKELFKTTDENLTHFIRAFNLTRQLNDVVKGVSIDVKGMEEKLVEYFQTSKEMGIGFILQNIYQNHLDIRLLDQIMEAAKKSDINPSASLVNFLYQELSGTNKEDKMMRVEIVLSQLGLAGYERKQILSALEKVLSKVTLEQNRIQGLDETGEMFLGMVGARILDARYRSKESRRKASEKVAQTLSTVLSKDGSTVPQAVSYLSRALMDTEQDVSVKMKDVLLDIEIRSALSCMYHQQVVLQEYAKFLESASEGDAFSLNPKVTIQKQKDGMALQMRTGEGVTKTYKETELRKKTGKGIDAWLALHGAMHADSLTPKLGVEIRKETSLFLQQDDLAKGVRKSLFRVSKDMKEEEIRGVVSFLKRVVLAGGSQHHKITGDTTEFISRAIDLGLLDESLTRKVLEEELTLESSALKGFQNGLPVMIIGRQGLDTFQDNPKTLLINSTASFQASMVGLMAFLKNDRSMIDQLQKSFKERNEQLDILAKSLGTVDSALNAIKIIIPEIKPILESILSQLADEEETILIAG